MTIELTSGALATLRDEATAAHPRECCGLLLGRTGDDGVARVERVVPAANVHPQPERRFELDPAALIAAHRAARTGGAQVLGHYHSHPGGDAAPSACDRACAAGDGQVWGIIGGATIRFWRDAGGDFEALPLRVAEG